MDEFVVSKPRILSQSATPLLHRLGTARVAAAAVLMSVGVVAAFGFAPDASLPIDPPQLVVRRLPPPKLTRDDDSDGYWREERIQRGDTLGSVLARLGIQDAAAQNFLRTD